MEVQSMARMYLVLSPWQCFPTAPGALREELSDILFIAMPENLPPGHTFLNYWNNNFEHQYPDTLVITTIFISDLKI